MQRSNAIALQAALALFFCTPLAQAASEGLPIKILAYDAVYDLHHNGTYTGTIHEVVVPLSHYGVQKYGQVQKQFSAKMEHVTVVDAYTLSPSGKRYPVPEKKIFTRTLPVAQNAPEFSDAKTTTVVFPHVAVGDELVADWKIDFLKPYFPNAISLSHAVPYFLQADNMQIIVHAPTAMALHWAGSDGYAVTHTVANGGQTITATLHQPIAQPIQINAVDFHQVSPTFILSTFPNWQAVGDAYGKYAEPAEAVTPEIKALADKITEGKTGEATVQALYDWTVHHIRWVGVETGLSGYKPYPAAKTLSQRYGDCKAAAALLVALLHAKGIAAQPVLLGAGNDFEWQNVASLQQINHVIVHVPAYHLYLDATSGYAPAGTIPLPDANHPVIFVGAHSETARTPGDAPEASGMTGMETVSIAKDGSLKAQETLHLTGYEAWFWKDLLARIPMSEYGAVLHHVMAQSGLMTQSVHLKTSPTHTLSDPFILQSTWKTAPGVPLTAASRIHLHYGLNTASLRNLTARLTSATVRYPVFMPYGHAQWNSTLDLPKGYSWDVKDADPQVKNSAGVFDEKIHLLAPDKLEVTSSMRLAHMVYSPEAYPDLYKLVSEAMALEQEGFAVKATS